MKDFDKSLLYNLRLLFSYKDLLRGHLPPVSQRYFANFRKSQLTAASKLKGKKCLEVAFFVPIPGMWKTDELFLLMQKKPNFHPFIVIYPYSVYKEFDKDETLRVIERTKNFFDEKGYEYVIPYDKKKGQWIEVQEICKYDIIFFSSPYKDTYPQYYIYNFRDTLTCYVPYGFCSLKMDNTNYNMMFHNLVGLYLLETDVHRSLAIRHSRNHGANAITTGYPATEVFLRDDYHPRNMWKPQDKPKKKVIYAPHHSVDHAGFPSVFLDTCDAMLEMAEKFADDIQFVFKPHQLLKFKLQQIWGVEKTDEYYRRWDSMPNTQLVSDGYVDLFITSDAMIHDCGSFTTEYLFTKKPVMYLCRKDVNMEEKFNEFGVQSFRCHYQGQTAEEVERFLQDVVVDGNDPMMEQREEFFDSYLKPKNGVLPSQKIIDVLERTIVGE